MKDKSKKSTYSTTFGVDPENPSPNETYLYLQPLSLDDYPNAQHYLYRAYATREFKNRERQTKEEITFSLEYPDMSGIEMLVPQQQTGFEYKEITRETVPTPQEWKAKVSAGEWFVYAEPKVSRSTSKIVEWEKKKRAKRIKNVLQCPMC